MNGKKPIGKILLQQRALRPEELERALSEPAPGRLASRLAATGVVSDVAALKALSEQHGIPGIDLSQLCLSLEQLDLLPREIAEKHRILPVLQREDRLFVAMADPREKSVIDELEFVTGKRVYPYVALESAISQVIDDAYQRKAAGHAYYIGPNCPAELLQKVGINSDGEVVSDGTPSVLPQPEADSMRPNASLPHPSQGVVVDDQVDQVSRADDVEEQDFGKWSDVTLGGASERAPAGSKGKHVLVVDDEAEIRKMLTHLLTRAGYRVIEAERGMQALRIVREQSPDLIVLDAMLPEVHGFEIARRIKSSELYRHIPIIMVSAVYRGWRYAEDLKNSFGVDRFIEKPFRIGDVLESVEAALKERTQTSSDAERTLSAAAEQALNQGIEAYRAGRIDEAIEHLKRGTAIDPLAFRLHFHLGLLYGKKGQIFDAIAELEAAVESYGEHFPALKNLAILYQKAGFRNRAVEMWERALPLSPDEPTRQSIRQHLLTLL
ncbi:MAG TPA: response regulator [Polyangiaceae bacterium]|nr:response regulator [Polyangiaceae bacterium]